MASSDIVLQRRTATALAHLAREEDLRTVFVDRKGLEILMSMLIGPEKVYQIEAAGALFELAKKVNATALVDPTHIAHVQQDYLASQNVSNPSLFDVVFLVEGRNLHAHRATVRASSEIFRAMFDGHYKEKDAAIIPIPNMRYVTFEAMMRYIHTGTVEVTLDIAQELLLASDQYNLERLKRLCEGTICRALSVENIQVVLELAESANALQLSKYCAMFALEHFRGLAQSLPEPALLAVVRRMVPQLEALIQQLIKKPEGL